MDERDPMSPGLNEFAGRAERPDSRPSTTEDRQRDDESRREYARRYREANKDKIADYRRRYKTERREHYLKLHREQSARAAERRRQAAQRSQRKHHYYVEHRDAILPKHRERARAYIERKMTEDPVAFRAHRAELARQWRARNQDRLSDQARERRRADPEKYREAARRYRADNPDKVKAANRRYYEANRDKVLAANRQWKEREQRRRDAGLPPRRIHKINTAERRANRDASDAFFTGAWSNERLAALRDERVTKAEINALRRDNERARAIAYAAEHPEMIDRLRRADQPRAAQLARQKAEEARMDDIARRVNDQLRTHPRTQRPDPAAPHQALNNPQLEGPRR
ncbi:MAG: hypothetical protein K0Q52_85 [Microbacterium sp.]|jgi:hypothetical protein|nr:hypothetical protein [Microbacterium sp.]